MTVIGKGFGVEETCEAEKEEVIVRVVTDKDIYAEGESGYYYFEVHNFNNGKIKVTITHNGLTTEVECPKATKPTLVSSVVTTEKFYFTATAGMSITFDFTVEYPECFIQILALVDYKENEYLPESTIPRDSWCHTDYDGYCYIDAAKGMRIKFKVINFDTYPPDTAVVSTQYTIRNPFLVPWCKESHPIYLDDEFVKSGVHVTKDEIGGIKHCKGMNINVKVSFMAVDIGAFKSHKTWFKLE